MLSFADRVSESASLKENFTSRLQVQDISNSLSQERINAATESLLQHNGPTESGVVVEGHRLCAEELDIALEVAYEKGLSRQWRPRHFAGVWGRNQRASNVEELVLRKVRHLKDSIYEGDLFKLITQASAQDFLADYVEEIEGRRVNVTFNRTAEKFHNSPYEIVRAYLSLTSPEERERFAELKPWHFKHLPKGILSEPQYRDELIALKIDQLLPEFDGDFYTLANKASYRMLSTPLTSVLDGRSIELQMTEVMKAYDSSTFKALCAYLKFKHGQGKLMNVKFLPPYFLQRVGNEYSHDTDVLAEVFVLMVKSLIKEHGSIDAAMDKLTVKKMRDGFTYVVDESEIHIATKTGMKTLGVKKNSAKTLYKKLDGSVNYDRWNID